jgi:hypothetical protein
MVVVVLLVVYIIMMCAADEEELSGMIRKLGLYRKRAKALVEFSRTYLDSPPWRTPVELKYFGKYADDSYRLFCLGGTSLPASSISLSLSLPLAACPLHHAREIWH